MNPPFASHLGSVWKRQICSACNALTALLQNAGQQLDDEWLRTFMCESEALVNSRPLTTDGLNAPTSLEPLTPIHLLTSKANALLPLAEDFKRADLYSCERWCRVQHLANEFWILWKRDFLQSLQERQKCSNTYPNIEDDRIVLLKNNSFPKN